MAKTRNRKPDLSNIAPALQPLARPIAELIPDPKNAKLHPQKSLDAIAASLRRHGQQKNIVIVEGSNIVIAGNGTLAAAQSLGWTHLACNPFPDEASARAFAIEDNRSAELAPWDIPALQESLDELAEMDLDIDFDEMGFGAEELDKMIAEASVDSPAPREDSSGGASSAADTPPAPRAKVKTKPGDVWVLGSHRLVCGEASESDQQFCNETVERWQKLSGQKAKREKAVGKAKPPARKKAPKKAARKKAA